MIGWVAEFFGSLPAWYWVAVYTAIPVVAIGVLVAGWKVAKEVGPGPLLLAFAFACLGVAFAFEAAAKATGHADQVIWKSIFVGLVALLVGYSLEVLATKMLGRVASLTKAARMRLEKWRLEIEERQRRDPGRVMTRCRKLFEEANRGRMHVESPKKSDVDEFIGFGHGGEYLLKIQEALFGLVASLDIYFVRVARDPENRERADGIFPDVPLKKFEQLLGVGMVDPRDCRKLHECAKGLIERIALYFEQLPTDVMRENIFRDAGRIDGLPMEMAQVMPLPLTTSSLGTIADLETGRIHQRIREQLAASIGCPAAVEPHPTGSETTPARTKVRA